MASQNPNSYQLAQEYAHSGDITRALECIMEYLEANPSDGKALNDAGAILYSNGQFFKAQQYLQKALLIEGKSPEVLWNLAEVYLAQGKASETAEIIEHIRAAGIINADLLNRTAKAYIDQDDTAHAIEMLLNSLELWPQQEILKPMLDILKAKRPKIAYFIGDNDGKFVDEIIKYTKDRFPVKVFEGGNLQQMHDLMQWSDISWFEWCTNTAIEASKLPRVCRNIIRLHRWEAYTGYAEQVNWENIDVLVTVGNSYVAKALRQVVPDIDTKTNVLTIPNGVNLDKFKFVQRTRGKNIAVIGYLNMRKNPMFLVQCMQKLHYIDPEYKLYFAGNFQDRCLEQYVRHMVKELGLSEVIIFDGWQKDVSEWLADKHYIISASIGESQGMGLLEGMATGLKPIIHNFPGADEIFASEFLFNIAEDFCRQVLSESFDPLRYREFVAARYPQKQQLCSINEIFNYYEFVPLRNNRETDLCRARLISYCQGKGIDIGCGDNKICPEAIGIDLTQGLGDIVADARKLPFENESMDYAFSSHCLEDLEDTPAALAEWMRVVKQGGHLILYLPHRNFYPRVGKPGANPHHKQNLDPSSVLAALSQANDYEVVHLNEYGTGGEHSFEIVVKKLAPKVRTKNIGVQYEAVVGDVICIEPAVRALKRQFEDFSIIVRTPYPELFRNNPCIDRLENSYFPCTQPHYDKVFECDWKRTLENSSLHLVDKAAHQIGVTLGDDKCPRIYLDEWDEVMLKKFNLPAGTKVAIGPDVRWQSRQWPKENWCQLCKRLVEQFKVEIIQLGADDSEYLGFGLNLIDKTTPREVAAIASKCALVIAPDTGIAHLAAAVGAPRVVLFGPVLPKFRMHAGDGIAVTATDCDCKGCFHTEIEQVRVCPKGHTNCMKKISVDDVLSAAAQLLSKGTNC